MDKESGGLNTDKIQNRISEIKSALQKTGFSDAVIDERLCSRREKFAVSEDTFFKIVSGKDWIIPFWKKVITKTAGGKLKLRKETWKFKLVDFCSLDRLENLKQKIITTVKA